MGRRRPYGDSAHGETAKDLPQRPQSHVTADVGVSQVSALLKSFGWTAEPVIADYGEDLYVEVVHKGVVEGASFRIQLKSTDNIERYKRAGDYTSPPIRIQTAHHWLSGDVPVMLLLWDTQAHLGVYEFVQHVLDVAALTTATWKSKRFPLPRTNMLESTAAPQIRAQVHVLRYRERSLQIQGLNALRMRASMSSRSVAFNLPFLEAIGVLQEQAGMYAPTELFWKVLITFSMVGFNAINQPRAAVRHMVGIYRGAAGLAVMFFVQVATGGWGSGRSELITAGNFVAHAFVIPRAKEQLRELRGVRCSSGAELLVALEEATKKLGHDLDPGPALAWLGWPKRD